MAKQKKSHPLTGKQKKFLRSLGHHLSPLVIVGREGITDNLIASCDQAIEAHELVKIKLGQNCPLDKKDAAEQLTAQTDSQLVQLIGKTVLLYRANAEKTGDEQIRLPEEKKPD